MVIPIKDLDSKNVLNKAKVWEIQFNTWSQDEINFSLFVDGIGFDGAAEAAGQPAAGQAAEPAAQVAEPVQVAAGPGRPGVAGSENISEQIMVDQFGFRPQSEKIIIFASPQQGQNAGTKYTPPAKASVRREKGGATVLTVDLKPWGGGKTDRTSGDKVWYADISPLQAAGTYYIYDATNRVRSYNFRIADDVYLPVLKAAIRAYFYQRCGGDVPAANGGTWHHPACHTAAGQDMAAQLYIDGRTRGQPRDVHGGWHDAGDYNKYVPFTMDVVQALLMAYEFNPSAFGDDWNIPESGNGIPDILDEVRWECDWLLRMQMPDGSVCNRVTERTSKGGVTPDKDSQHERYYTQPTSWATATCAANLAYFCAGDRQISQPGGVCPQVPRGGGEGLGVAGAASGHDAGRRTRPRAAQRGRRRRLRRRQGGRQGASRIGCLATLVLGPAAQVRGLLQEVAEGHAPALFRAVRPLHQGRSGHQRRGPHGAGESSSTTW